MELTDDLEKRSFDHKNEFNERIYKKEKRLLEPFTEDAKNHPEIKYEYEPPGSLFKQEMVEKYM